jgi:hypothetical protein
MTKEEQAVLHSAYIDGRLASPYPGDPPKLDNIISIYRFKVERELAALKRK